MIKVLIDFQKFGSDLTLRDQGRLEREIINNEKIIKIKRNIENLLKDDPGFRHATCFIRFHGCMITFIDSECPKKLENFFTEITDYKNNLSKIKKYLSN